MQIMGTTQKTPNNLILNTISKAQFLILQVILCSELWK